MEITEDERIRIRFIHNVINKLQAASSIHMKSKLRNRELDWNEKSTLNYAKEKVLSYLEDVQSGNVIFPKEYSGEYNAEKLREAHVKANFDWTDRKKYFEFQEWFSG